MGGQQSRLGLSLKVAQRQILTPGLVQMVSVLALNRLELREMISQEVTANPVLEELPDDAPTVEEIAQKTEATPANGTAADAEIQAGDNHDSFQEIDFGSFFDDYLDPGYKSPAAEVSEKPSFENFLSKPSSLGDHLEWQLNLSLCSDEVREAGHSIIGNLNEDGYLSSSIEELARLRGTTPDKINGIREKIKMFDPVGVGSLNVREAWLAQMDSLQIHDDVARAIVMHHLPLLEKSDYLQLSRALNIPMSAIKEHVDLIKGLDPKPGRKYNEEKTTYAFPDISVAKEGDEWKVTLNNEGVPRLRISRYYRRLLAQSSHDQPEAYRFLVDNMKKAVWFIRSLDQRDRTIHKVAQYIVNKQQGFFDKGLDGVKPLTLMEIAQDIGVHESTVGRVVANKYILTPQGVFPLKFFFHKSLPGNYGEEVSSLRIKEKIKKLVEGEDSANPLSDIEIGDLLARENLKIARRTVAKYRMQLKIEPSHIRKRKSIMEERA